MIGDPSTYEVVLTWREAGGRREVRGDVMGRATGVDAAEHLVDVTFASALTRTLVSDDGKLAIFSVDQGGETFQVEAGWRAMG